MSIRIDYLTNGNITGQSNRHPLLYIPRGSNHN